MTSAAGADTTSTTSSAARAASGRRPRSFHTWTKRRATPVDATPARADAKASRRLEHSAQRVTGQAVGAPHRAQSGARRNVSERRHESQRSERDGSGVARAAGTAGPVVGGPVADRDIDGPGRADDVADGWSVDVEGAVGWFARRSVSATLPTSRPEPEPTNTSPEPGRPQPTQRGGKRRSTSHAVHVRARPVTCLCQLCDKCVTARRDHADAAVSRDRAAPTRRPRRRRATSSTAPCARRAR